MRKAEVELIIMFLIGFFFKEGITLLLKFIDGVQHAPKTHLSLR